MQPRGILLENRVEQPLAHDAGADDADRNATVLHAYVRSPSRRRLL
jgi:hypothetical protein